MSVVTLQLGQCGNQIGEQLFGRLRAEAEGAGTALKSATLARFFREGAAGAGGGAGGGGSRDHGLNARKTAGTDGCAPKGDVLTARAVLVDMEPKVVSGCLSAADASGTWRYDGRQTLVSQSGSANNWAFGYNSHGRRVRDGMLERVRREAEQCDMLDGFLTLHSAAGGTGSGLGTHLTEAVRDEFPDARLLNAVVWPHDSGEVIVQHYNSLLTTAHLAEAADGVLLFQNDVVAAVCRKLLHVKSPTLGDLNGVIARSLAAALLPYSQPWPELEPGVVAPGAEGRPSPLPLSHMLSHLCSHPGYKLLNVRMIPQLSEDAKAFSTHSWPGLVKHLVQMQVEGAPLEEGLSWRTVAAPEDTEVAPSGSRHGGTRGAEMKEGESRRGTRVKLRLPPSGRDVNRAVAAMLLLRGADAASADVRPFLDPVLCASWRPRGVLVSSSRVPFDAYPKFAAVVSNDQSVLPVLERTVASAHRMFAARAYLHQYAAHGLTTDGFVDAFARCEQIIADYNSLC